MLPWKPGKANQYCIHKVRDTRREGEGEGEGGREGEGGLGKDNIEGGTWKQRGKLPGMWKGRKNGREG